MNAKPNIAPAIGIAAWLNAARLGEISKTDAANACETLTDAMIIQTASGGITWRTLVEQMSLIPNPLTVVLPVPGDPCGVPQTTAVNLESGFGVVAIGNGLLLGKDSDGLIRLHSESHAVTQPDLIQLRGDLQSTLQDAAEKLTAADLIGQREVIDTQLEQFAFEHLPPTISGRVIAELNSAARLVLVASHAVTHSTAIHSPSLDAMRVKVLGEVRRAAEQVMCALASR
jgi:hypothetical protein